MVGLRLWARFFVDGTPLDVDFPALLSREPAPGLNGGAWRLTIFDTSAAVGLTRTNFELDDLTLGAVRARFSESPDLAVDACAQLSRYLSRSVTQLELRLKKSYEPVIPGLTPDESRACF